MPQHQYLRNRRRINDRNPSSLSVQTLCRQYGCDAVLEAVLKEECACPTLLGYVRVFLAATFEERAWGTMSASERTSLEGRSNGSGYGLQDALHSETARIGHGSLCRERLIEATHKARAARASDEKPAVQDEALHETNFGEEVDRPA